MATYDSPFGPSPEVKQTSHDVYNDQNISSVMGRLANQILPIGTSPSPTLSWPPSSKRRSSLVFGGRSAVGRMKRRLKLASSGNLAKNSQNERRIWDCLGGGRIEKSGGPVVSRDYQSLR